EEELERLRNTDETTEQLEKDLDAEEKALIEAATELSTKRKIEGKKLSKEIQSILKGLALEKAVFECGFKEIAPNSTGMDEIEFLFSANKGEEPKSLQKVASGGELSRIMLAIKTVLRGVDKIPTLVFDEVDAGIGGKTAQNVATRLKESSSEKQVLCITHLPQIAAVADTHMLIEKSDKGNTVVVIVRELKEKQREEEIARMLGGDVTSTSLKHARELLKA
ncbi:DNA repair protein RecN, partial [Nitrospirota bacterium]